MKKTLGILLIAILLCTASAFAQETAPVLTSGDFAYLLLEDGTAQITAYTGSEQAMTVPETLDGVPVSAISGDAFSGCLVLSAVNLPENITILGGEFVGCDIALRLLPADHADTVFQVKRGSCAELYLQQSGMPYVYLTDPQDAATK